jgi:hypothetical protein
MRSKTEHESLIGYSLFGLLLMPAHLPLFPDEIDCQLIRLALHLSVLLLQPRIREDVEPVRHAHGRDDLQRRVPLALLDGFYPGKRLGREGVQLTEV